MEEATRTIIFAAALFAIAFSSGQYTNVYINEKKSKIWAINLAGAAVLAVAMLAGTFFPASATVAQAGCFLLLSVSAVRRVIEMQKGSGHVSSLKQAAFFTTSEAAVAGFGAGLGGVNIMLTVLICIVLNLLFILNETQPNRTPDFNLSALGAVLFISLAVLL